MGKFWIVMIEQITNYLPNFPIPAIPCLIGDFKDNNKFAVFIEFILRLP